MTVWGVEAVERAAADPGSGERVLRLASGDLITPLARDRAAELGLALLPAGPAPASSTVAPSRGTTAIPPGPARSVPAEPAPPSGALYRRGAPRPDPTRSHPARSGGHGRVVVVGAGHVGMITAARLAEADVFDEVVLTDVVDGLAAGIALDLTHCAALLGFGTRLRGCTDLAEAGPAEYVVITAGRARQPGMTRGDLAATNAAIVGSVATAAARHCPDAVIVVVTNPLDEMTHHAWLASGFPPQRVLGMAGVLDTARFQALTSLAGVDRADRIQAIALGSHGDEMVVPLSQARVSGRPLAQTLDRRTMGDLVERTRDSGAEVVGLLRTGSAFFAPGAAAARMVLAMVGDTGEVLPAAVLADGSYGISGVYLGLPARLGHGGVRGIVELPLTVQERAALHEAAERVRGRIGSLATA